MTITVRVPTALRVYIDGAAEITLEALTVRAALAQLERHHLPVYRSICDDTGAVRRHVNLFVNASHIRELGGLDAGLEAGDVLTVLPAVSGG
jgi:molybdopterin converting factor small subunit